MLSLVIGRSDLNIVHSRLDTPRWDEIAGCWGGFAMSETGTVVAVCRDGEHRFSKGLVGSIRLVPGLGVEGDAHAGEKVQHRFLAAADPTQPNLRQVHLMHEELFAEFAADGYAVGPGELGENVTTSGIDLLALPRHTILRLGDEAVVEVTGLRNPCLQINGFRAGLLKKVVYKDADGQVVRKAGIMSVVRRGGVIEPGAEVRVEPPEPPYLPLERV